MNNPTNTEAIALADLADATKGLNALAALANTIDAWLPLLTAREDKVEERSADIVNDSTFINSIVDGCLDKIEPSMIAQEFNASDIAEGISASDIAQEFTASDIASEVAEGMCMEDIAYNIDLSNLAEHIDTSDITPDAEDVAGYMSANKVAQHIDLEAVSVGVAEIIQDSHNIDERKLAEESAELMMSNGTFVDQLSKRMLQLAGWQSEADRNAQFDHQLNQQKHIDELKAVNVELRRHLQELRDKQVH